MKSCDDGTMKHILNMVISRNHRFSLHVVSFSDASYLIRMPRRRVDWTQTNTHIDPDGG